MIKVNYLNNRELLKEIHNSKNTFSSYIDSKYSTFDAIINDLSEVDSKFIKETLVNKAERIVKEKKYEQRDSKIKTATLPIDPNSLEITELVFRVMTDEHIPHNEEKPITNKPGEYKKTKLNFPPFKHYIIESYTKNRNGNYKNLIFKEVGRSHWVGGLNDGHFSVNHGRINNKLGLMFLKLVERYSQRGNWRGYSYNEEMRGQALLQLSQVGLQFNEAKSQNPFSYYTETINNSFTRVLNTEKKNQQIRDDLLISKNSTPSFSRQFDYEEEMKYIDDKEEQKPQSTLRRKKIPKVNIDNDNDF